MADEEASRREWRIQEGHVASTYTRPRKHRQKDGFIGFAYERLVNVSDREKNMGPQSFDDQLFSRDSSTVEEELTRMDANCDGPMALFPYLRRIGLGSGFSRGWAG